jgi:peptide/nickel transport system substrate-binding protein
MTRSTRTARGLAAVAVLAMTVAGCGSGSGGGSGGGGGDTGAAQKGGTLTFLTLQEQLQHLDPQRNYTGEDLAFMNAYVERTLTAYKLSPDGTQSTELVPDLATDTGTPSDGAKTWTFTLKDGATFEDGTPITCADVKYGVSRTFATSVITDGPSYAISMLDIPTAKDGTSVYKGPYTTKDNDTAAFDKAVQCTDDKTVVFHLKAPVGDFNYTVTLLAFSPVPKSADTGEKYDDHPVSSGPYKIQSYEKGNQLVLVRNQNWSKATDSYRPAYPDKIVVKFGLDTSVIDQRLIADSGEDSRALTLGDAMDPSNLATVFTSDRYADRRVNDLDPYVRYIAINTTKVPNLDQRKAIAASIDRAQLRTVAGGAFAGDLADGVVKPNLPADYAPTGMWTGLLGQNIPDSGDPAYAKQLITQSGAPMKTLRYDYPQTPTNDRAAAALVGSMKRAGITVRPNPIEAGQFYSIVQDPAKEGDLVLAGWGPDWTNASTVVPELFTPTGGFDLSLADDKAFNEKAAAAKAMTDRDQQAAQWKDLDKQAMANVWVVPTRFGKTQRLAGSNVGDASGKDGHVYLWAPFGSWPYADLFVKQ